MDFKPEQQMIPGRKKRSYSPPRDVEEQYY